MTASELALAADAAANYLPAAAGPYPYAAGRRRRRLAS